MQSLRFKGIRFLYFQKYVICPVLASVTEKKNRLQLDVKYIYRGIPLHVHNCTLENLIITEKEESAKTKKNYIDFKRTKLGGMFYKRLANQNSLTDSRFLSIFFVI